MQSSGCIGIFHLPCSLYWSRPVFPLHCLHIFKKLAFILLLKLGWIFVNVCIFEIISYQISCKPELFNWPIDRMSGTAANVLLQCCSITVVDILSRKFISFHSRKFPAFSVFGSGQFAAYFQCFLVTAGFSACWRFSPTCCDYDGWKKWRKWDRPFRVITLGPKDWLQISCFGVCYWDVMVVWPSETERSFKLENTTRLPAIANFILFLVMFST